MKINDYYDLINYISWNCVVKDYNNGNIRCNITKGKCVPSMSCIGHNTPMFKLDEKFNILHKIVIQNQRYNKLKVLLNNGEKTTKKT